MDPFNSQNPLQPFGFPGDPMEDVLSLQGYSQGVTDEEPVVVVVVVVVTVGC